MVGTNVSPLRARVFFYIEVTHSCECLLAIPPFNGERNIVIQSACRKRFATLNYVECLQPSLFKLSPDDP